MAGKRIINALKNIEAEKSYALGEAISVVKKNATAKFDETIEVTMNLGVDPKYSDQMVRGVVALPSGTGKTVRVAVFAKDAKADEAREAGADLVGDEDLIEKIKKGELNFDRCIATPDMMAKVGAVAKILGPKGLMPNPKLGTVTLDVKQAVKSVKAGQVEFKVEKCGIVQAGVGKAGFSESDIVNNVVAFINAVNDAKPTGAKGTYIKKVTLCSTMGPSVVIEHGELLKKKTGASA